MPEVKVSGNSQHTAENDFLKKKEEISKAANKDVEAEPDREI